MKELTSADIRLYSRLGSCGAFGMAANELPKEDALVSIVTADLCFYSGLTRFQSLYPDAFYNVGIAEQNLVGVAAGLAKEGFHTFATTYASFAVTRALDQVRVNMGYMGLPIKLVGLTSGFSVGILGPTHICIEDLAIMRSIPNVVILSPADCTETFKATVAASKHDGPVYIRLTGGMPSPIVYGGEYEYEIGKAIMLKSGTDIGIVATGSMVYHALQAAGQLEKEGIFCDVVDMHTIKPLDYGMLERLCDRKFIVTLEEHSVIGGLGSAVADYLAERAKSPVLYKIGIPDTYAHAASYEYLIEKYGLTTEKIVNSIKEKAKEIL